jgi:hypothetical protein
MSNKEVSRSEVMSEQERGIRGRMAIGNHYPCNRDDVCYLLSIIDDLRTQLAAKEALCGSYEEVVHDLNQELLKLEQDLAEGLCGSCEYKPYLAYRGCRCPQSVKRNCHLVTGSCTGFSSKEKK